MESPLFAHFIRCQQDELIKLDDLSSEKTVAVSPRNPSQASEKPVVLDPSVPIALLKAPVYHPLTVFVSARVNDQVTHSFIHSSSRIQHQA
jgi:hypothetical protein